MNWKSAAETLHDVLFVLVFVLAWGVRFGLSAADKRLWYPVPYVPSSSEYLNAPRRSKRASFANSSSSLKSRLPSPG